MKVSELQIGDWVYVTAVCGEKCEPFEQLIRGIEYNSFMGDAYCDWVNVDWNNEVSLSDIEPIPLTTEILEKNGWEAQQFWHEYRGEDIAIQSCLPDMRGIINGMEIQHFQCEYVHQYQHLLRLCGLDELADNFKIE